MSWYSDEEPFNEHEPECCRRCTIDADYNTCHNCIAYKYSMRKGVR